MDALSPTAKAKATELCSLGLPEAQAIKSAVAHEAGSTPTHTTTVYGVMKMNDGCDEAALKAALQAYGNAARASSGQTSASYGMANGEVIFQEMYDSPSAMDIHIANCFPSYIKMLPHCTMTELICTCHASELEFWTTSAGAWGASKFVVTEAL
jgi:hypothetical protein